MNTQLVAVFRTQLTTGTDQFDIHDVEAPPVPNETAPDYESPVSLSNGWESTWGELVFISPTNHVTVATYGGDGYRVIKSLYHPQDPTLDKIRQFQNLTSLNYRIRYTLDLSLGKLRTLEDLDDPSLPNPEVIIQTLLSHIENLR